MSTALIASLKAGCLAAFEPLAAARLSFAFRLARQRLRWPATAEDAEEVASSVVMSLFRHLTARRNGPLYAGLSDTASLLRTIALLTHQKARRWVNRHLVACRDRRREVALATDPPARLTGEPVHDWDHLLAHPGLTDRQRAILTARRDLGARDAGGTGRPDEDIWQKVAERVGVSRRTVFRELAAVRRRLGGW